jgi:hypothetical protein
VPALVPPDKASPKELFASPEIAFPATSLTTTVTVSIPPEATDGLAKLTTEFAALTPPGVTVTVGLVFSATPPTVAVRVLAVPAVVPVKVAVYVPGVAV